MKKRLLERFAKNQISEILSELTKHFSPDSQLFDKILFLSRDYYQMEQEKNTGVLSFEDESKKRALWNQRLMSLIKSLPDEEDALQYAPHPYFMRKKVSDFKVDELLGMRAQPRHGYQDFYLYREPVDRLLLESLYQSKHTVVRGKALAGKSRAVYETLKNYFPDHEVWLFKEKEIEMDTFFLPDVVRPTFCIFDDVERFLDFEHFAEVFNQLLNQSQLTLILTCRTYFFEEVENTLLNYSEAFHYLDIPVLNEQEKRTLLPYINQNAQPHDTIGSYFLPITAMKKVYEKTTLLEKEILRSYKCIALFHRKNLGNKTFLQAYCEKRFQYFHQESLIQTPKIWFDAYANLANLGLIQNYEANIYIENAYLQYLIASNESEKELISEIVSYYPTTITYTKLIQHLNKVEDAYALFQKMKQQKIQPNVITFNTLMNKVSDYEECLGLLQEMEKLGVQPDVITFNTLMNKVSDYEECLGLLQEMEKLGVQPNVITFNTLMNKVSDYEECLGLLQEMEKLGVQPDVITFTTLINKANLYLMIIDILSKMKENHVTPDEITYNTFLPKIIKKTCSFSQAKELCEYLQYFHYPITPKLICDILTRIKSINEQLQLVAYAKLHKHWVNKTTFRMIFKSCKTMDEGIAVLACFGDIQGFKATERAYWHLLQLKGTKLEAETLLAEMKKAEITPTRKILDWIEKMG